MLDFRSDFPFVIEDIADADMIAELEVGRQAVIVVIVQLRQHVYANTAFCIEAQLIRIFKAEDGSKAQVPQFLMLAWDILIALAIPAANAGIPVTAQLRTIRYEPGFIPVRGHTGA